jgi:hypothetical protein
MPSFEEILGSLRSRTGLPATPPQVQQAMLGQTVAGRRRRIEDMLAEMRNRAGAGNIPNLSNALQNAGQAGAPGGPPNYQAMAAALASGMGGPPGVGAGAGMAGSPYSTIRVGRPVFGSAGNPYAAGNDATGVGLQLGPAPQEGDEEARRRRLAFRSMMGY